MSCFPYKHSQAELLMPYDNILSQKKPCDIWVLYTA